MNRTDKKRDRNQHLPFSPEEAWKLWHQLSNITDKLWHSYEQPFLEFCIADHEPRPKENYKQEELNLPF
jgi:hypothetical protein